MSHESTYVIHSPTATRPYPPYTYQFKPYAQGNSQIHPIPMQRADRFLNGISSHMHEPKLNNQPRSDSQVDWVMKNLRQETNSHNETRSILQSSRQATLHLETLLYQERTFNHSLRVKVQEAEMKRIAAEGRVKAYEQAENSIPTPISDYKSATFSPSINLTLPGMGELIEMSSGKRKAQNHLSPTRFKRPRGITSPVSPVAMDVESEEE